MTLATENASNNYLNSRLFIKLRISTPTLSMLNWKIVVMSVKLRFYSQGVPYMDGIQEGNPGLGSHHLLPFPAC